MIIFDYFCKIKDDINTAPKNIQDVFTRFKNSTINELWDSPEEIFQNYQKDSEYQKLLEGEEGINVMYNFLAEVTSECMDDWADYILNTAYSFIKNSNIKDFVLARIKEVPGARQVAKKVRKFFNKISAGDGNMSLPALLNPSSPHNKHFMPFYDIITKKNISKN